MRAAVATEGRLQLTAEEFSNACDQFAKRHPDWTHHHAEGFLSTKAASAGGELTTEHHIVYHASFQVPCLYFASYSRDGDMVDVTTDKRIHLPRPGVISQQLHPILQMPVWFVHPCDTVELLRRVSSETPLTTDTYLDAWLSVIGPFAGFQFNSVLGE